MWHNGKYPASYQHQPVRLRQKALEIANNLLANGLDESSAAEMGLRKARDYFLSRRNRKIDQDLPAWP